LVGIDLQGVEQIGGHGLTPFDRHANHLQHPLALFEAQVAGPNDDTGQKPEKNQRDQHAFHVFLLTIECGDAANLMSL
jgi:hypothetical protein